jgi:hypothetical protein
MSLFTAEDTSRAKGSEQSARALRSRIGIKMQVCPDHLTSLPSAGCVTGRESRHPFHANQLSPGCRARVKICGKSLRNGKPFLGLF